MGTAARARRNFLQMVLAGVRAPPAVAPSNADASALGVAVRTRAERSTPEGMHPVPVP
ncbi:uncharacterized protein TRAVEDRAFT_29405, partial [Trametes versicolor FP-101664 SS1]|uniref:uncharacterized protein n=1 Tax=Trametes versicolor (strain FP-101664) TaxID=717944 RepID=UPI0004621F2B